jgi:hypothetical protein
LSGFLLRVCERTTVMRFVVMTKYYDPALKNPDRCSTKGHDRDNFASVIHLPFDLALRLIPRPFETSDVVLGGQQKGVSRIEIE